MDRRKVKKAFREEKIGGAIRVSTSEEGQWLNLQTGITCKIGDIAKAENREQRRKLVPALADAIQTAGITLCCDSGDASTFVIVNAYPQKSVLAVSNRKHCSTLRAYV